MTLDWDDLRFFLAILRAGGLPAAARRLGVTTSTVYRRLDSLEAALGVRLIERGGRGMAVTPAGEELQRAAETMHEAAEATVNRIAGRDLEPAGLIRITAPDDLADSILMPLFADFRARYPRIRLELVTDNRFLNLTRREADVALRPTRTPPETLLGRRVAKIASAAYASPALAKTPLDAQNWITWEEGLGPSTHGKWLTRILGPGQPVLRVNSMRSLGEAAARGLGAALLPCHLGDPDPRLVRILAPQEEWDSDLWLLTHPGLGSVARIRLLTDELFRALRRQAALFSGDQA